MTELSFLLGMDMAVDKSKKYLENLELEVSQNLMIWK